MIDPDYLTVPELAERWKQSHRQIISHALAMRLPVYFAFDGLAIDIDTNWHRGHGAHNEERELESLRKRIRNAEDHIALNARGEADEFSRMGKSEIRSLRARIAKDQERVEELIELLQERSDERLRMEYRGHIRALPDTLWKLSQGQQTRFPLLGLHPNSPVHISEIDGKPHCDGHIVALEPGLALWVETLARDDLLVPMSAIRELETKNSDEVHASDSRVSEAMGLLVEAYVSKQGPGYRNGERPNVSSIVKDMAALVSTDVHGMGDRKLKDIISEAIKAWEAKKHR